MDEWSAIYKESKSAEYDNINKEHLHPNAHQIIFIMEGEMVLTTTGKQYPAKSGSLVFISNIDMHSVKIVSYPYKRYIVNIPEAFIQNIQISRELISIFYGRTPQFEHCVNLPEMKDSLHSYLNELVKESRLREKNECKYCSEAAASLLILFLIRLYREKSEIFPVPLKKIDSTIYNVKAYIDNNYGEDITVEELSSQFYLSQSYLSQNFKQLTGHSPKRYIMLCRVAAARALLYNTDMSISDIVAKVGFNDTNNFIRYFKKETGMTPFQFRKSLRNDESSIN